MPRVTFVSVDGSERTIDATIGDSLMATAVRHGVPGIVGECGGNRSCGTCHVYVRPDFFGLVGGATDFEQDLLDLGVLDQGATSRLSCQIEISEALDGLTVETPRAQA